MRGRKEERGVVGKEGGGMVAGTLAGTVARMVAGRRGERGEGREYGVTHKSAYVT